MRYAQFTLSSRQLNYRGFPLIEISENGLNLNVYTPAESAEDNLPVLVWIHGGANNHGNASEMEFNASKLADQGIIVVSVQYRLGMYGFLTLPGLAEEKIKMFPEIVQFWIL